MFRRWENVLADISASFQNISCINEHKKEHVQLTIQALSDL